MIHTEKYKNNKTLDEYWQPGFLIPATIHLDHEVSSNRWCWWVQHIIEDRVPLGNIPQISWERNSKNSVSKKLTDCVFGHYDCDYTNFLDFILYGYGHMELDSWKKVKYSTIHRWEENLHEILPLIIKDPYPYFTDFLEEEMGRGHKKGTGFFATPMTIATFSAAINKPNQPAASVLDPAAGTGNMLLAMSNYSVNLYAQDVDRTVLKGLQIHSHLYMPWMVLPMPSLTQRAPILWGDTLSDGVNGYKSVPLKYFDYNTIFHKSNIAV